MTVPFFMLLFHAQQAAEESVSHPALCNSAAVCATKDPEANGNWICHDGETNPRMCDENRIMLLGRRSFILGPPGTADSSKWPVPCIDDTDCAGKCYARRCQSSQAEGDTERLYVYVNGACGTIGPHASANVDMAVDVLDNAVQATIKCEVDTSNSYVPPLSTEFVGVSITKFGQLQDGDCEDDNRGAEQQCENTCSDVITYTTKTCESFCSENTKVKDLCPAYCGACPSPERKNRVWDLRAKAEACSLCSLYTARNLDTHAWIEENQFWQCKVYKDGHEGAPENNCTHIFGDNIFVARENVRELETIGYDNPQPAYLVSGVVPQKYNEEWSAWTFSPPLLDSKGSPYIEMDANELSPDRESRNYDRLNLPQLSGLFLNHNPRNADSFTKVWSFFGFAEETITLDNDYFPVEPTMYASQLRWCDKPAGEFRTKSSSRYHLFGPILKDASGYTYASIQQYREDSGRIENLVPESLCTAQPSYCCHNINPGAREVMCASALPPNSKPIGYYDYSVGCNTVEGLVECGLGLRDTYGLNHAFRVLQCNARGGNMNMRTGYMEYNPTLTDDNMFAADVLVVPRSWDTRELRYGWAKLADLRDVDRTQYDRDAAGNTYECKFVGIPGQPYRDYCLRRDRGTGTNSPFCLDPNADADEETQLAEVVFSALNQNQAIDEYAQGICCDDGEGIVCDYNCMQYVTKRETTTTTTTPTTTTTTLPETFLGDLLWPLILNNNGLFRSCTAYEIEFGDCAEKDVPDTTVAAYDANVCAIEYAYFARSGATKVALTFQDVSITAHTRCRDGCTAWKQCVSYAYEDNTCTIYANANCATEFSGDAVAHEGECVETDVVRYTALTSTAARCAAGYTLVLETALDTGESITMCALWNRIGSNMNDQDTYCSMAFGDYVCCGQSACLTVNDACPDTVTDSPNENGLQLCLANTATPVPPAPPAPAPATSAPAPPDNYRRRRATVQNEDEYTLGQIVQLFGESQLYPAFYSEQIYNPLDWPLLQNYFEANLASGATESENAVRKGIVVGTETGATTIDAFDLYYGYHLCPLLSYPPKTQRTETLNNCMDYARDLGATMFVWTGRLHSCDVYDRPTSVEQVKVRPQCEEIAGYVVALVSDPLTRQRPTNAPVFGIRSTDTTKRCPPRLTTTTTTETVSTGSSAEPQKAVYASVQEFCKTPEMRYIWPAFAEDRSTESNKFLDYSADVGSILDDEGFPFQEDQVETNKIRFYLNPKLRPQCTEERPALDFVYGDGATATTTPTTTATTTTPTFVNRFTDDDTRVTLGVVIGVLSIGAVLSIVAALKA